MYYLAKTTFGRNGRPGETIEEHTGLLMMLLERFVDTYPGVLSPLMLRKLTIAVLVHDLGKMSVQFQNKLRRILGIELIMSPYAGKPEVYHNFISPAFVNARKLLEEGFTAEDINDIRGAAFYHHERPLPDQSRLKEIVETELSREICLYTGLEQARMGYYGEMNRLMENGTDPRSNAPAFIMLLGLLNRLDYGASAHLDTIEESVLDGEGKSYADRTRGAIAAYGAPRAVQSYLAERCDTSAIVVAATGSGKTEAALLWGNGQKMFYTLPVRTAINSMYERIKRGSIAYSPAAILHADALSVILPEYGDDEVGMMEAYEKTRQLAAPLTVCTVDQILRFILRGRGSERLMATLSYSCVVIDEIQAYDQRVTANIIAALKWVRKMGGRFLVMTATLPKLLMRNELLGGLGVAVPPPFHTALDRRHRLVFREEHCWEEVAAEVTEQSRRRKVLVICNTVKQAQKVFSALSDAGAEPRLIHSRFIRRDRARIEREILAFAPNGGAGTESGIWVATQVVNASIDIDFDVLYSELCGIDELMQRMGRVYRGRNIDFDGANVFVLDTGNGRGSVVNEDIYDYTRIALESANGELLTESDEKDRKQELMDMVYDPDMNPAILQSGYYTDLIKNTNRVAALLPHKLEEQDIREAFRCIDSVSGMPADVYDSLCSSGVVSSWESRLKTVCGIERRMLIDEIRGYTVSIPVYTDDGRDLRHVYAAAGEIIFPHSGIYLLYGRYSEITGFERMSRKKYLESVEQNMM